MAKDKKNMEMDEQIQQMIEMGVNMWRRRKFDIKIPFTNKVIPNQEVKMFVQDVIDDVWKTREVKPMIMDSSKGKISDNQYEFTIHLPPGITYAHFKEKENFFRTGYEACINIGTGGKVAILTLMTETLKDKYKFEFNPALYSHMKLPMLIGYSAMGWIVVDLWKVKSLLVGGPQGTGKTTDFHVGITSLLLARSDSCFNVVFDFKGADFEPYMHDYGLLRKDIKEAKDVLISMNLEVDKRYKLLAKYQKVDVYNLPESIRPPAIVLWMDELTEIQHEKEMQWLLNRWLRLGRAAGCYTLLATQKPSAKTFKDKSFTESKALCLGRTCHKVQSPEDSKIIINNPRAYYLPQKEGRAIWQWDREIEIQVPFLNPEWEVRKILEDNGVRKFGNQFNTGNEPFVWKQPTWDGLPQPQGLTISKQKYNL